MSNVYVYLVTNKVPFSSSVKANFKDPYLGLLWFFSNRRMKQQNNFPPQSSTTNTTANARDYCFVFAARGTRPTERQHQEEEEEETLSRSCLSFSPV